jgi:hypothetical protein
MERSGLYRSISITTNKVIGLRIRTPNRKEAKHLYELQRDIFDEVALDLDCIEAQLSMFPEGFFVAELEQTNEEGAKVMRPVGLAIAVLWDSSFIPDYGKIHGTYPHTHTSSGKMLFIHTVGVHIKSGGKGIGTALVGSELNLAALLNLDTVRVISNRLGMKLFERLGFAIVQPLPEFLPFNQDKFPYPMLMELRLR